MCSGRSLSAIESGKQDFQRNAKHGVTAPGSTQGQPCQQCNRERFKGMLCDATRHGQRRGFCLQVRFGLRECQRSFR